MSQVEEKKQSPPNSAIGLAPLMTPISRALRLPKQSLGSHGVTRRPCNLSESESERIALLAWRAHGKHPKALICDDSGVTHEEAPHPLASQYNACTTSALSLSHISNVSVATNVSDDSKASNERNGEELAPTKESSGVSSKQQVIWTQHKILDEISELRYQLYNNLTIEMTSLRNAIAFWNYNGLNPILTNILSFNTMASNEIDYLNQRIDSISKIVVRFVKMYKKNMPRVQSTDFITNMDSTQPTKNAEGEAKSSKTLMHYMPEYQRLRQENGLLQSQIKEAEAIFGKCNELMVENENLQKEVNFWKMKYITMQQGSPSDSMGSAQVASNGELAEQNVECYAVSIDNDKPVAVDAVHGKYQESKSLASSQVKRPKTYSIL